jgi:hypothetical protein
MANILELIQRNDMLKVALILLGVYLLISYMQKPKSEKMQNYYGMMPEQLENVEGEKPKEEKPKEEKPKEEKPIVVVQAAPVEPAVEVKEAPEKIQVDKIVAGSEQVKPEDLLPKYGKENDFAKENPVTKLLKEQNFLISGYHVGINTVMQSNKIPYQDIRSLPPIPKESVGPWNQSSFEQSPAQMRRFFEIGV